MTFSKYVRTNIAEMRPYVEGETLDDRVSVSASDVEAGSPKTGDMIARNPKNHDDQWLVAAKYFRENFRPATTPIPKALLTTEQAEALREALVGDSPDAVVEWHEATGHEAPTLLSQHDEIDSLRFEVHRLQVELAASHECVASLFSKTCRSMLEMMRAKHALVQSHQASRENLSAVELLVVQEWLHGIEHDEVEPQDVRMGPGMPELASAIVKLLRNAAIGPAPTGDDGADRLLGGAASGAWSGDDEVHSGPDAHRRALGVFESWDEAEIEHEIVAAQSLGTTQECRRCSQCPDLSHHWIEDFDDGEWEYSPDPRPVWACKHCDFTMPMDADDTEGEHVEALYEHTLNPDEVSYPPDATHVIPDEQIPPGDWHSVEYFAFTVPLFTERKLVPVPHIVDGAIVGCTVGLSLKGSPFNPSQSVDTPIGRLVVRKADEPMTKWVVELDGKGLHCSAVPEWAHNYAAGLEFGAISAHELAQEEVATVQENYREASLRAAMACESPCGECAGCLLAHETFGNSGDEEDE